MADAYVNYVLRPFGGNIKPGDPKELKLYLLEIKQIDKEADTLDISVSNAKYIIDNFLNIANKYSWVHLIFMVETGAGTNK